jgi:hypothetical protein
MKTDRNNHIEERLESLKIERLTESEKREVWNGVVSSIEAHSLAPYSLFGLTKMPMHALIALVLLLGLGGTAAASDSSKPGDTLFGLDLAVEDLRLALANAESKDDLKLKFASERLDELEAIMNSSSDTKIALSNVTEIEADIFTNETVVKVEANDRHYLYTTNADTRAEIVAEVSAKFGIASATVDSLLNLEVEDRASRPDDKDDGDRIDDDEDDSRDRDERARISAELLSNIENEFEASGNTQAKAALLNLLEARLGANTDFRFRMEESDDDRVRIEDDRIEIREDGERFRLDIKSDGEVRIKSDSDDESDDDDDNSGRGRGGDDDDSDDDSDDDDDDSSGRGRGRGGDND